MQSPSWLAMVHPQRQRVVVLGGEGDLAMRYLAPAFADLLCDGRIGTESTCVGVGRTEIDTRAYRERVRESLADAGAPVTLAEHFEHARGDATSAADLRPLLGGDSPAAVVYLALPPGVAARAIVALADAGIEPATVVAVEKPFGTDGSSARALNRTIAARLEPAQALRVDHFVTMRAVRDLSSRRSANPVVDRAIEAASAVEVAITWDEALALEGRAGYYDSAGAVVDMVQSHLLQVLAAIAMERPATESPADVSRARLAALRATRARSFIRARYGRGRIGAHDIPAYADEAGVDEDKRTETFARVLLEVDTPRWRGVPFVVRTGKALARDAMEVTFTLAPENRLAIGLADEGAYVEVLDALLRRDESMFVSADEVEAQWAVVEPVLDAFREDRVPLLEYAAGSGGPT